MDTRTLAQRYLAVREQTLALAAPLSAEDSCAQSMPDASPVKWHLAHTTWFFETFILERWQPDFRPFHPAFRVLFNSYYNAVGDKHPRPQRGLLTRPPLATVREYRNDVDRRILAVLDAAEGGGKRRDDVALADLLTLGLHHEQQHQELILTDLKHLFSRNPLAPAYSKPPQTSERAPELSWQEYPGGVAEIGHRGDDFCFDNETPRHRVFIEPFQLASRLVTNREYLEFVDAGGYTDPRFWLSEGWDWRTAENRRHPLYWHAGERWQEFTLGGLAPLDLERPVVHVSYYEADAFARWAGARLPSEAEWEFAAATQSVEEHFGTDGVFHPRPASDADRSQFFGEAWQWTQSSYAPYPGLRISAGAVGEYNGKFMVNQYVLRGSSCVTPPGHARATYRNFFPASACWQFSGIRLARD